MGCLVGTQQTARESTQVTSKMHKERVPSWGSVLPVRDLELVPTSACGAGLRWEELALLRVAPGASSAPQL